MHRLDRMSWLVATLVVAALCGNPSAVAQDDTEGGIPLGTALNTVDTSDDSPDCPTDQVSFEMVTGSVTLEFRFNNATLTPTHLNRDKIESNLSVLGIQGHQENALIKSFEMSPNFIYL